MRTLLILIVLSIHLPTQARVKDMCTSSWRVGQRIVKVGDDVGRAIRNIDKVGHRVEWLRGPKSNQWTLATTGYNQKTIQIKIKNGRLSKICQFQ